jgi:N-acetylglutamate synthase-like GNAT family acetyltransferase
MEIHISTDKKLLDVSRIHEYINTVSYWGRGRTLKEVQKTIENSLCFGMYNESKEQLGFARVVTDQVAFGYIMDVIIFEPYKGSGLGTKLIDYLMKHEVIKKLKTIALKTKDAHQLYEKFDFKNVGDSDLWMANDRLKLL